MPDLTALRDTILDTWRINNRITTFLVEHIPAEAWAAKVPGSRTRTLQAIAAHLHNTRGMWLKVLGAHTGVVPSGKVDTRAVAPAKLVAALNDSSGRILQLLHSGLDSDGRFPGLSGAFVFGALPTNVVAFLGYALSHESHHRGQIVMLARQSGYRLEASTTAGLWQWSTRLREAHVSESSDD